MSYDGKPAMSAAMKACGNRVVVLVKEQPGRMDNYCQFSSVEMFNDYRERIRKKNTSHLKCEIKNTSSQTSLLKFDLAKKNQASAIRNGGFPNTTELWCYVRVYSAKLPKNSSMRHMHVTHWSFSILSSPMSPNFTTN